MAAVSLTEAARLAGVSRKTVQRRVQDGVLSVSQSVHGDKTVEISELIRVFGALPGQAVQAVQGTMSQPVRDIVHDMEVRIRGLEAELAARNAQIEAKDQVIQAQQENLADVRQALKLLEGPSKRWWSIFRK
jgi:hypothetical protein